MSTNYKYISHSSTGLLLTPAGAKPGDEITYENKLKTGADSQTWDFTSDGFFVNKSSGCVLEAPTDASGHLKAGTVLTLAKKTGKSNQKWTFGTPDYLIVSQQDKTLCIWVPQNQVNPTVKAVVMAVQQNKPSQRFFLLPA